MSLANWFVRGSSPRHVRRAKRHHRPHLETLEPRFAPSYGLYTLASFNGTTNGPKGSIVSGLIIDNSGNLYGETEFGGVIYGTNHYGDGYGTVFELAKGSSTITTLATFNGSNGDGPTGGLIMDNSGNLYGTTDSGGAAGYGTVFEVARGSGTITTLANFNGSKGTNPFFSGARLIMDSSGNLYGTKNWDGTNMGTVFEVAKGSGTITTLATFNGNNGALPIAGLIMDTSGNLYGTTRYGGEAWDPALPHSSGYGTVFEVAVGSGTVTTLAAFSGSNGAGPETGLIMDSSGNLYGCTTWGGLGWHPTSQPPWVSGSGTVFELAASSGSLVTLASVNNVSENPTCFGTLVMDSSGNLYGTTYTDRLKGDGTVFEVANSSGTVTTLALFNGSNGNTPFAGLLMDSSGNLYGTTESGGANGDGTVFELPNPTIPFITTFSLANWTLNQPGYSQTISSAGGTGTITFTTTAGTVPAGLVLSSTGVFSGTPTAVGTYTFTVTATDTVGETGGQTYTVSINPPVTLTPALPSASVGAAYHQTIAATGGTGTLTFSSASPLPAGLTLSTTGALWYAHGGRDLHVRRHGHG